MLTPLVKMDTVQLSHEQNLKELSSQRNLEANLEDLLKMYSLNFINSSANLSMISAKFYWLAGPSVLKKCKKSSNKFYQIVPSKFQPIQTSV